MWVVLVCSCAPEGDGGYWIDYSVVAAGDDRDPVIRSMLPDDRDAPCPIAEDWRVVTWPEREIVASTPLPTTVPVPHACDLTLETTEPLLDRWYAVEYVGEGLNEAYERFRGGFPLNTGTRVFPFLGFRTSTIEFLLLSSVDPAQPSGISDRVEASPASDLMPAPGTTYETAMRIQQGALACVSTGEDRLAVTCEGFEWDEPVEIHIDGLVHLGERMFPHPPIELTAVVGSWPVGGGRDLRIGMAPVAPHVPTALCAGIYCE